MPCPRSTERCTTVCQLPFTPRLSECDQSRTAETEHLPHATGQVVTGLRAHQEPLVPQVHSRVVRQDKDHPASRALLGHRL